MHTNWKNIHLIDAPEKPSMLIDALPARLHEVTVLDAVPVQIA